MNERADSTLEVRFSIKRIRTSPHKLRKVVAQIRGCSCLKALMLLDLMPYRACSSVFELVLSAVTDASNTSGLAKATLWISNVHVDPGPVLRKMRARAQGRGYAIRKRTCSITLSLKSTAQDDMHSSVVLHDVC